MTLRGTLLAAFCVAAATAGALWTTSLLGQIAGRPGDSVRSVAYFSQIVTVLQHPRCMNCHTAADFPRQGDDRHPHIMEVRRGPADNGMPALPCSTCHQKANAAAGVPGDAVWHLAPLRMAWEGLTTGEICRALTAADKGGMTHARLLEHIGTDSLVAWAWNPGRDLTGRPRSTPPISQEDFVVLLRAWVESGAECPI